MSVKLPIKLPINISPCFIPSPPNGVDAFSLVRKVQGRSSGAGEASKGNNQILLVDSPASSTRQKQSSDSQRRGCSFK